MAKNSSASEKTIKDTLYAMSSDTWLIDNTVTYGNYANKSYIVDGNILDDYRDYFENYLVTVEVADRYFYSPSMFAEDYYGTPDLDFLVMYFANITTLFDFNQSSITVLDKSHLTDINKLIVNKKTAVSDSYSSPTDYIESPTVEITSDVVYY